jgi:DNA-binding NarL/FixJ family response regulator
LPVAGSIAAQETPVICWPDGACSECRRSPRRPRAKICTPPARPRRITRSRVDALTASELRVARLAAAGATNPEIAQELYVTIKTVEAHLSSAYDKLGLSGQGARDRLPAVLSGDTNAMSALDFH